MAEAIKKLVPSSPFMGRSDGYKSDGQIFEDASESVIIEYKEVASIRKTGEGPHDFVVIKKIIPSKKINRDEHINSFTSDVGIMNVLKKVLVGGETIDDVVKSGQFASKQKGLVDLSDLPNNIVDAYRKVEAGVKAFDELPDKLKKKQSFAAFAESFSKDDFQSYIAQEVQRVLELHKKQVKKDGDK